MLVSLDDVRAQLRNTAPALPPEGCAGPRSLGPYLSRGYRTAATDAPRSEYRGYASVSARTSSLTRATVASSLAVSTVSINSATRPISSSMNPREVSAGVPSRIPLVTKGHWGSRGMVVLFTAMPDSSDRLSASLQV